MAYVDQTEAPLAYHRWSAISVVSSTLKRNVFMQREFTLYPNQYIILTGPPGIGKGAAISPASDIAKKAGSVNYLSDRITAEKIIERLEKGFSRPSVNAQGQGTLVNDSCACILSKELPVFIGSSEWMLPYLCEMWDRNEFEYATKTKQSHSVKDLCVGLLAGCVPDFIRKLNKDSSSAITGGFTSRCMYIYASHVAKNIDWPELDTKIEPDLVDDLRQIGSLHGEMLFNGGRAGKTFKMYSDYKLDSRQNGKFEQAVIVNFKSRVIAHMLKTAMTLSVSESDSLVIEDHHITQAINMVTEVMNDLEKTFRFVGENTELVACQNIMDFLEYKGAASFNEILSANYRYANYESIQRIMMTLESMNFAIRETGGLYRCKKQKQPKP